MSKNFDVGGLGGGVSGKTIPSALSSCEGLSSSWSLGQRVAARGRERDPVLVSALVVCDFGDPAEELLRIESCRSSCSSTSGIRAYPLPLLQLGEYHQSRYLRCCCPRIGLGRVDQCSLGTGSGAELTSLSG